MRADEFLRENEEPEEIHFSIDGHAMNTIMQNIWKRKYPDIELHCDAAAADIDQPVWTTDDGEFEVAANGHELYINGDTQINEVGIADAWTGKYKGVMGDFIKQMFEYAEKETGRQVPRRLYLYSRDGSDGAWEHLASKLNAELIDTPYH